MNEIKSIWDGWEKQLYGCYKDDSGGACALGAAPWGNACRRAETLARVAAYIRTHYPMPWGFVDEFNSRLSERDDVTVIVYANNTLKLTPEDFREIDRQTQVDEALKSIEAMLPDLPEPSMLCEVSK